MQAPATCSRRASNDWRARIAELLARRIAQLRRRRQQATWRREVLALDARQLRDAGIDLTHVKGRKRVGRDVVAVANLAALR